MSKRLNLTLLLALLPLGAVCTSAGVPRDARATLRLGVTRAALDAITLKQRTFIGSLVTGDISVGGNPLKHYLTLMMDRWIGPDFEQGLASLKTLAEKP